MSNNIMRFCDDYTIIDIETTGLSRYDDEIIEISAVRVRDNQVTDCFDRFVKPHNEISSFITQLTGISNETVANSPDITDVIPDFLNFVGDDIVAGHNVNFDIGFIKNYCDFSKEYIDTMYMSRAILPELKRFRLSDVAGFFNIDYSKAHRSSEDCLITFQCINHLRNKAEAENIDIVAKFNILFTPYKIIETELNDPAEIENRKAETQMILEGKKQRLEDYIMHNIPEMYLDRLRREINSLEHELILLDNGKCTVKVKKVKPNQYRGLKASDIIADKDSFDESSPLYGKVCVFTGELSIDRGTLMQMVADIGGINADNVTKKTDYLIVGDYSSNVNVKGGKTGKLKKAEDYILKGVDISIISEKDFFDLLNGDEDNDTNDLL